LHGQAHPNPHPPHIPHLRHTLPHRTQHRRSTQAEPVVSVPAALVRALAVREEHRVPPAAPAEPARTLVDRAEAQVGLGKPVVAAPDRTRAPDLGRPVAAAPDRQAEIMLATAAEPIPEIAAAQTPEIVAARTMQGAAVAQQTPAIVAAPAQPDAINPQAAKLLP